MWGVVDGLELNSPEINPYNYAQLVFNNSARTIQREQKSRFNKLCWEDWLSPQERMELDPYLTPYTQKN